MSKDAKLGLVVGVALVIVIAVVFFRKDPSQANAAPETAAAAVKPKGSMAAPGIPEVRPAQSSRRHTVSDGDTLFNLAERYYNDRSRFVVIYEANRDYLITPDRLTAGTVLVIPE